jgi:hypothetical protein
MRSKFLTVSALALCCLFVGRSARADSVRASLKADASFTSFCMWDCAYNVGSFHGWIVPVILGSWEPRATYYDMRLTEWRDFSDFRGNRPWLHDRWTHGPVTLPVDLEGVPSAPVPTPEPSSLLLTGVGLIGLAFFTKGFRRKQFLALEAAS